MAFWEFYCSDCDERYTVRTYVTKPFSTKCPKCSKQGRRMVSEIGYRRDHTVL